MLTSASVARLFAVSRHAASDALEELAGAGVVKKRRRDGRTFAYLAMDVFDLIGSAERRLASTRWDTGTAPPSRAGPARPPADGFVQALLAGEADVRVTAGWVIGAALVLHVLFIALLVRRALGSPRPTSERPVGPAEVVPAVLGAVLTVVTLSYDARDVLPAVAFSWVLWLLLWAALPWLQVRLARDGSASRLWSIVVGLLGLGVVVLCVVAGDWLAQRVI